MAQRSKTRTARPARETDLYGPVRDYLAERGYRVRGEVDHCDLAATKDGDLIVVELKRQFGVDLLIQATQRQAIADSVYVALPRPPAWTARWRGIRRLLRRLELGLIFVSDNGRRQRVEVVFHPQPYRQPKRRKARRAVIDEMAARSADYNEGGSRGRKLMTAYRESAVRIAALLAEHGPLSPRRLRALGTGDKTQSILYRNVYGWFERKDRGLYALSPQGRRALEDYPDLVCSFREAVSSGKDPLPPTV